MEIASTDIHFCLYINIFHVFKWRSDVQKIIGFQSDTKHSSAFVGLFTGKTSLINRTIEVSCAAGKLSVFHAISAILLIQLTGFFTVRLIQLTTVIQKPPQPVVILAVAADCLTNTLRCLDLPSVSWNLLMIKKAKKISEKAREED